MGVVNEQVDLVLGVVETVNQLKELLQEWRRLLQEDGQNNLCVRCEERHDEMKLIQYCMYRSR